MEIHEARQMAELALWEALGRYPDLRNCVWNVSDRISELDMDCYRVIVEIKGDYDFAVDMKHHPENHACATETYALNFAWSKRRAVWGMNPDPEDGMWELREGSGGVSFVAPASSPDDKENSKLKADRTLDQLCLFIPRRHREFILGDLREDIAALREEGETEKTLCRYVYWQVFCAAVEKLKPWNWAAFVWLVHKFIR